MSLPPATLIPAEPLFLAAVSLHNTKPVSKVSKVLDETDAVVPASSRTIPLPFDLMVLSTKFKVPAP
ncbi:hypothetical protein D3C79_876590 [compost metagenome]